MYYSAIPLAIRLEDGTAAIPFATAQFMNVRKHMDDDRAERSVGPIEAAAIPS